jgi:hypothetical protein
MTLGAMQGFDDGGADDDVASLQAWLLDQEDTWPDGYTFGHIEADDVDTMAHTEDVSWDRVLGAGVPMRMRATVDGYAAAATEADQSFAEPSTYIKWDRTIVGGTAEGFVAGEPMQTTNDIEKSGPFGIVIPYSAPKDFRWFGDVLAARTWVPEPGFGDDGKNGIVCGFTIELWFEDDGDVVWYNGSWTELVTVVDGIVDDDLLVSEFIDGTRDYMLGTEAHVMGEDAAE